MKGATCNFCGKGFRNRQAVRAHLKSCQDYTQVPKAPVPSVGSPGTSGRGDQHPGAPRPSLRSDPGQLRPAHPSSLTTKGNPPNTSGLGRWTIQSVKKQVVDSWWSLNHTTPAETKAKPS